MNAKSLAVAGAVTVGLLVPAGSAMAAPTDDNPGPLGGLLGVVNHNGDDNHNGDRIGHRHVNRFFYSGTIRSINVDDRVIVVGHGRHGGDTKRIHIADDAKIMRDGDSAHLRDLREGDHVRLVGSKKDGKLTASWVRAVS
jgi:hypothetical protein